MFAHAQAPVRVGIAGGGTDLPVWTKERVGHCLSLAIKMYTHAVAIHRPDGQVVASYAKRDVDSSATEIANGLIRESALLHGWEDSFEVHTLSELSSKGSGLGVSSSIAVSLAACFDKLARMRWTRPITHTNVNDSLLQVARDAWVVEIDRLHRPIGRQDHMAAAFGGLRLYEFEGSEARVKRSFSPDDAAWVAKHLLLVKLPEGHDSRAILSRAKDAKAFWAAAEAVPMAVEAIEKRDLRQLGLAVIRGHASKFQIPGASPQWIEDVLQKISHCAGFYGCKIAGAGGGGHVAVVCEPGAEDEIAAVTMLPVIKVEPDLTGVRSEGWM